MSVYNPVHAHKKQFLWWRDTEIPKRNMNIRLLGRLWHPHLRDLHFIISFPAETFFLQLNKSLLLFFLLCVSVSCLSPSASSSSLYPEPRNACLCANTGAAIGSTLSLVFSAVIKQCSSVWARECLCKTERQKQKKKGARERESLEASSVLWPGFNVDPQECGFRSCRRRFHTPCKCGEKKNTWTRQQARIHKHYISSTPLCKFHSDKYLSDNLCS